MASMCFIDYLLLAQRHVEDFRERAMCCRFVEPLADLLTG